MLHRASVWWVLSADLASTPCWTRWAGPFYAAHSSLLITTIVLGKDAISCRHNECRCCCQERVSGGKKPILEKFVVISRLSLYLALNMAPKVFGKTLCIALCVQQVYGRTPCWASTVPDDAMRDIDVHDFKCNLKAGATQHICFIRRAKRQWWTG